MENKNDTKKITLGSIVSWIFGVIFFLVALGAISGGNFLTALFAIIVAVVLMPPIEKWIEKKIKIKFSAPLKVVIVIVGIILMSVFSTGTQPSNQEIEQALSEQVEESDTQAVEDTTVYDLEIQNFRVYSEYGYAKIDGEVKNISGESMDNVMVVGSFYTSDGTFVKSADALIDYNPILPDQTSPFGIITSGNPEIATGKIEFKKIFGGTISAREAE